LQTPRAAGFRRQRLGDRLPQAFDPAAVAERPARGVLHAEDVERIAVRRREDLRATIVPLETDIAPASRENRPGWSCV